ncbi:hypothetical protein [Halomarina ordinaria]|uniref:Uncharacterized protein n=1 Tax=Halomarina ordinaria TaxID=3033939 RepID=A0ABD5UED9_9EURY|nr:hypothetical protein [Halomarina sp. PSRA2]
MAPDRRQTRSGGSRGADDSILESIGGMTVAAVAAAVLLVAVGSVVVWGVLPMLDDRAAAGDENDTIDTTDDITDAASSETNGTDDGTESESGEGVADEDDDGTGDSDPPDGADDGDTSSSDDSDSSDGASDDGADSDDSDSTDDSVTDESDDGSDDPDVNDDGSDDSNTDDSTDSDDSDADDGDSDDESSDGDSEGSDDSDDSSDDSSADDSDNSDDSDDSDDSDNSDDSDDSDDSDNSDDSDDSDDSSADDSDDSDDSDSDDSAASDGETHTLVVDGQQASTSTYQVTVSGELTPLRGGTDDDTIGPDGSTLSGQVDDGYDAYEFTGDLRQVQVSGKAVVKVDGEVVARAGGATDQRPDDQNDESETSPYAVQFDGHEGVWEGEMTVDGESETVPSQGARFEPAADAETVRAEATNYEYDSPVSLAFEHDGETYFDETVRDKYGAVGFDYEAGASASGDAVTGDHEVTLDRDGVLFVTKEYQTDDGVLTTMEKRYPDAGETTTIEGDADLRGVSVEFGYPDGVPSDGEFTGTLTYPDGSTETASGDYSAEFSLGTAPSYY